MTDQVFSEEEAIKAFVADHYGDFDRLNNAVKARIKVHDAWDIAMDSVLRGSLQVEMDRLDKLIENLQSDILTTYYILHNTLLFNHMKYLFSQNESRAKGARQ